MRIGSNVVRISKKDMEALRQLHKQRGNPTKGVDIPRAKPVRVKRKVLEEKTHGHTRISRQILDGVEEVWYWLYDDGEVKFEMTYPVKEFKNINAFIDHCQAYLIDQGG
jgi:hypothetical protein